MNDYSPESLSAKWTIDLDDSLAQMQKLWNENRPRKSRFSRKQPELDSHHDEVAPKNDLRVLGYEGTVALAHFARAFFPA